MTDMIIHVWNDADGAVEIITSTATGVAKRHATFERGNVGMQLFTLAYIHMTTALFSATEIDIDVDLQTAKDIRAAARLFPDNAAAVRLVDLIDGGLHA